MLTIRHHQISARTLTRALRPQRVSLLALALAAAAPAGAASWTEFNLPALESTAPHFGYNAVTHLDDGRFIYGNNNRLFLQDDFGAAAVTPYATPPGVDPSFLTVQSPTVAVVNAGQFGSTSLYQFNPLTPATPGYTAFASLSNYAGARLTATSLLVTGLNGGGAANVLSYVTLGGAQQVLVSGLPTFSAGVAVDGVGNVFVARDQDFSVFRFSAAQVQTAIADNTTLTPADGVLVHTFGANVVGTLAVDGLGRLWAAGFGAPGLQWWDPSQNIGGTLLPQGATGDYKVSAFDLGGTPYLSYVWQSGYATGDTVIYGYAAAAAVPEPASVVLCLAVAGLVLARRRNSVHHSSLA